MVWFIFALLTALFSSLMNIFGKKGLKKVDEYIIAFSWRFFSLPFLFLMLLVLGFPLVKNQFWLALVIGGTLNLIATILYVKAIKYSDLSISVPMLAFTPAFIILFSPFIINEIPTLVGFAGVFLIIVGTYVLEIKKRKNILYPFKALFKERGAVLMLFVAFIWAFGSIVDKIGVISSSPVYWVAIKDVYISLFIIPIMLIKSKEHIHKIPENLKLLIPIGLLNALMLSSQMTAISMGIVSYVMSIKRMSILFTVLFGYFIFKEKGIKERLLGAIIMIIGVILITVFS
ncbi:MAG: EamA family transporter [Candidatus Woesearchaeota archaeon]|nr:MAG: EamA family transporter [Candidatus Woesearchaeota archaeon]